MTAPKTIVVTWNDKRIDAPRWNQILVVLWANEGSDRDLNDALAYAASETRRTGNPHRVHTFACDDPSWRDKAGDAHAAGRGL